MKNYKSLLIVFCCSIITIAQTNVDKLVEELELVSDASFNNWKYSLDFSHSVGELSDENFNDSEWQTLKLNESIYPDSCWLRKVIELPEYIGGQPVSGALNFLISVDDYGYFFINGESKGHFPWSGEFSLTEDAKPGDKYVLVIRAVNTGGPLRLLQAQLDFENNLPIRKLIKDFILSMKVGQKLLSFDTYQTNSRVKVDPGIDKSKMDKKEKEELIILLNKLATQINVDALRNGDTQTFESSLNKIRPQLKPISEFAKRFTLQFTANAHIDAAWLWRKKETMEVCNQTFSSVMNMFNTRPNFTYSQSQAAFYEWMKVQHPDLFEKIKNKVDENRWEIVGGMWIEPDCNLPDGVSWSRQLLYAQKFFKENFGKRAILGWNPDSFGYNWNMPLFFTNSGIDVFITQKIGWNDTNVFPYRVFWWEAPDGSRILSYFPFNYVNDISNPFRIVDWMRQFEANTGFTKQLVLFGVGNHGGGPSLEMMKRIDDLKDLDIFPKIEFGTAEEYINWLKSQDLSDVPVWKDELYLEYHRGTFTTQSNTKKNNRNAEILLTNAEKFSSLAKLFGLPYKQYDLVDAWKTIMFNQFHDILPGSSIREVYMDSEKDYNEAFEIGNYILNDAQKFIAEKINTSDINEGRPVVIFNSLSWQRTDIVEINLHFGDLTNYSVYDLKQNEIPSQVISKGKNKRSIIFVADNIPSIGYKVFFLKKANGNSKADVNDLAISDDKIENKFFTLTVNGENGWLKSIIDKRNGKEILSDLGNKLQLLEDKPSAWDAWNIGLTGTEYPSKFRKMEIVENGPVRIVLRLYRDYLKSGTIKEFPTEDFPSSFFTQNIILYNDIDRIDFKTDVEWFEDKTMLKVAFPLTVEDTVATYEIPYGTIQRSTTQKAQWDKGKWEVPALRWADLSDDNYGVSLLNKAKYGYDIKENTIRLSLLRSPKWPDETADRGFHTIEYSLYPHQGRMDKSKIIRRGYEYNYPLLVSFTDKHSGELPQEYSFVKLLPNNLILASIKKAEDDPDAYIYQLYETKGEETLARLELPGNPKRCEQTDFLEDEGNAVKLDGNIVEVKIGGSSVMTLKVYY